MSAASGDPVAALPVNPQSVDDAKDLEVASKLFGSFQNTVSDTRIVSHFKPVVLAGVIFFILSLPQVDGVIDGFFSKGSSPYTRLLIRAVIFCVVLYFAMYYSLARA